MRDQLVNGDQFILKRHNQLKNHPAKTVFSLLDMSIICEHVHRLELRKSFKFRFAVAM